MSLELVVTTAGRDAVADGITLTQVGISATEFIPSPSTLALPGELKRLSTIAGLAIAPDQLHLTALDDTTDLYTLKSFALYLEDGTLFAAYSQPAPIMTKAAPSILLLAIDVAFTDIDATLITFGDTSFALPPATQDAYGLVKLASPAEAIAGIPPNKVVTAADLSAALASLTAAIAADPHRTQLGEGKAMFRGMPESDYYKIPNGQHLPLPDYQDLADALADDPFLAVDADDKAENPRKWWISDDETYIAMPDHRGDFLRVLTDDLADGVVRPGPGEFKASQNLEHAHKLPDRGANAATENKLSGGNGDPETAGDIFTLADGGDEANPDHGVYRLMIRVL